MTKRKDKQDWSWKPKHTDYSEKQHTHSKKTVAKKKKTSFYQSWEWKKLRYDTLVRYGAVCMLCNSTNNIVVDHIKPRSKFPELKLDPDNMQVLCNDCNMGKSNDDYTDFRPKLDGGNIQELILLANAKVKI